MEAVAPLDSAVHVRGIPQPVQLEDRILVQCLNEELRGGRAGELPPLGAFRTVIGCFRKQGIDIDGVDNSPDMLVLCLEKAAEAGVTVNLEEQFAAEAKRLREKAETLPPGIVREDLLRRARQAETGSHMTEWLSSRGLQSPR